MGISIRWITKAIHGHLVQGDRELEYKGITTDSRSARSGEIFWALPGDRFDGHHFIRAAGSKGVLGVVIKKGSSPSGIGRNMVVIEVDDTLHALGEFAAQYRRLHDIPMVAVTGSNGKTTTKEMIASILSMKRRVLKNEGNLNNLIGLPLTLLNLTPAHEIGVVELGMNRSREIARLTVIAKPTVGLITNIGPVHLEYLRSVEAVAQSKGELFQELSPEATAVVNNDDPWITQLARAFPGKKLTFGINHTSEVMAENITERGSEGIAFTLRIRSQNLPICLPMIGVHNVMNALAAAAVTVALGEDPELILRGLCHFTNLSFRQEVIRIVHNITVINDAYNANPISMETALSSFSRLRGSARGIAVLGDMLELGDQSALFHRDLGRQVAQSGVAHLLLLGEYATDVREGAIGAGLSPDSIVVGGNHQDLKDCLEGIIAEGDWVLVKGSRKMGMEIVVGNLMRTRNSAVSPEKASAERSR